MRVRKTQRYLRGIKTNMTSPPPLSPTQRGVNRNIELIIIDLFKCIQPYLNGNDLLLANDFVWVKGGFECFFLKTMFLI